MGFWRSAVAYGLAFLSQSPFNSHPLTINDLLPGFHDSPVHESRPLPTPEPFPNITPVPNVYNSPYTTANTCNTPENRTSWCNNTNIKTDYEDVDQVPNTGKTNYYTLVLTSNETFCGDGYCKSTMLINNTYPGPLLRGSWGDWFEITVINNLSNCNGTSIHWHGIRQWNTVWEDGVAGVTQCPIVPKGSQTYRWRATQYGSSWYHSHFSLQYADGLAGPLIIDGPTSMNYDYDMGPLMLTDWYHGGAFGMYHMETMAKPPNAILTPPSDMINGQGQFVNVTYPKGGKPDKQPGCNSTEDSRCQLKLGSNFRTVIAPSPSKDKRTFYKYRIVNMSTSKHYTFWIDKHEFWIVATDFVPIKPIRKSYVNVAIGQRYDIIIEAHDEETIKVKGPNFWIRTKLCSNTCYDSPSCVRDPDPEKDSCNWEECRKGILSYDASSTISPDFNNGGQGLIPTGRCDDLFLNDTKPEVSRDLTIGGVPSHLNFSRYYEVYRGPGTQNITEVFPKPGRHDTPPPPNPEIYDELKVRPRDDDSNLTHLWDFKSSLNDADPTNKTVHNSFMIDWANASLGLAAHGVSAHDWSPRYFPVILEGNSSTWTVFAIAASWEGDNNHGVPKFKAIPGAAHPIHVHGHDFVLLAHDYVTFNPKKKYKLQLDNPPRRDVVLLPAYGFVIIGFKLDNPGTWLMHCHIAWHASSGLALQWVERPGEIPKLMSGEIEQFDKRCDEWRDFEATKCKWDGHVAIQDDSGI